MESCSLGGISRLARQTASSEFLLCGVEEISCLRVVGQNPPGCDTEDESWDTLDDHDPAPAALACDTAHVANSEGEETSAGASEGGGYEEVANSESKFTLSVEEGEIDGHSREETTLDGTKKETTYKKSGIILYDAGKCSDNAPGDGDEGDPAGGGKLFQNQIGGNLGEDVGDE